MWFSLHFCVVATLISHVSCDFRCICNYMANLPVYSKPSVQSSHIGALDEYMCKVDAQSPLTDWFAIEYKKQVGYVQSNSGMVLKQNCPGSPPKEDAVPSVPLEPSSTKVTNPPSTSTSTLLTTVYTSIKSTTASTSTTTTRTTTSTLTAKTTSPPPTLTKGDINLCHPDLVQWSKESPVQFLWQFKNRCFATSFDSGTFDETVLHCKRNGGKIITVSSNAKEKFVETFVMHTVKQPVWIGANTNTNDYRWTSNLSNYTNWASSGFSISAVDRDLYSCSVLDPTLGGKWRITACNSRQRGVCEFPISNVQHLFQSTPSNNVGGIIGNLLPAFGKTTPAHNNHQNSVVVNDGDLTKCPMALQTWARSSSKHVLGQFGKSCYALDKQVQMSFSAAFGICRRLSGRLVDVQSQREQAFLDAVLQQHGVKDKVWIGLTDFIRENTFFWTSEARSTYLHWAPQEPSETVLGNRDCTLLNPRNHGLWETRSCDAQHVYFCEFGTVL